NPNDLCLFVEETCGYLLPWGLNSILTYLSMVAAELGQVAPEVCAYFAGMVKYGVAHPVAVCLVPFVDHDRELAMAAAALCPYGFEQPELVILWLLHATADNLIDLGAEAALAERIIERRHWQRQFVKPRAQRRAEQITLPVSRGVVEHARPGEKLLVIPEED